MRGCKCAMSMKAERKSLPRRSKSSVPWPMVRAGQVSKRQKMKMPAAARINMTNVSATGQEERPPVSEFDIGCWTLGVERFLRLSPKKYRPPRPMGVKGGCSPQNNLPKSAQLLPELKRCRNKNFYKLYRPSQGPSGGKQEC